jgi:hypothetical protein
MAVGGQHHAPVALTPGMTRYPSYRRLGGPQGRSGQVRKILPPPGFDPGRSNRYLRIRNIKIYKIIITNFDCMDLKLGLSYKGRNMS